MVYGGAVSVGLFDRIELTAFGQAGVLQPDSGTGLKRDFAEVGAVAAGRVVAGLWLEAGIRQRAYTSPIARQRWTLPQVGAAVRVPFAVPGLRCVGRLAVHPGVRVSGLSNSGPAYSGAVGVEYAPGRLGVQLIYARERDDFPRAGGIQRLEQLSAVRVGASWRWLGNPTR